MTQTHSLSHTQNFMIMPDALGITNIGDLSPVDLEKVRSLALLELTVTFEDHGIPLRSRRPIKTKNWLGMVNPTLMTS